MRRVWIDTPDALEEFCDDFGDVIAVDTESDHFHAYEAKTCLIQVATPTLAALIDPLALEPDDLEPLFEVFEDPEVVKILHASRNDLIELDRDYDVGFVNIFDTQVASRFLGYERASLDWLLGELAGATTSKKFQRFDWTTRPIPEDAQHYAAGDVIHLFTMRDQLQDELDRSEWARPFHEQCAYITEVSRFEPTEHDPEGWRRIKTRRSLADRDRAALRELYAWRHQVCTEVNRAALFVFDNRSLIKVACARPENHDELEALGIRHRLRADQIEAMLDAIDRSFDVEPPPARPPRRGGASRPPEVEARYKALKDWRNATCDRLGIPTEFLANNATLSVLAEEAPGSLEALGENPDILPWQRERFGEEILRILRG